MAPTRGYIITDYTYYTKNRKCRGHVPAMTKRRSHEEDVPLITCYFCTPHGGPKLLQPASQPLGPLTHLLPESPVTGLSVFPFFFLDPQSTYIYIIYMPIPRGNRLLYFILYRHSNGLRNDDDERFNNISNNTYKI